MKKTPLKKVSDKKSAWLPKYRAAVKARVADMKAHNFGQTYCERCLANTPNVEPHHTRGRVGANIMIFALLGNDFSRCRCHNFVHQNSKKAREEGWLR